MTLVASGGISDGVDAAKAIGLGADAEARPGGQDVEGDDLGPERAAERVGVAEGKLGVRPAAHRDEDALHLGKAALFDHGDGARARHPARTAVSGSVWI